MWWYFWPSIRSVCWHSSMIEFWPKSMIKKLFWHNSTFTFWPNFTIVLWPYSMTEPWPKSTVQWSCLGLISASLHAVYFTNKTATASSTTITTTTSRLLHHTPSILSHQPHQPQPTHDSSFSSTSSDVHLRHMTFVAGVPRPVRCVGVGGYPPPRLYIYLDDEDVTDRFTWLHSAAMRGLPGLRLMTFRSERTAEGFVVRPENDGQQMRCLATVADFSSQFARMTVRVHCKSPPLSERASEWVSDHSPSPPERHPP